MKKILFILLFIISICGYSQDEYYRIVDWKFYPENVIQLTDSTYSTNAIPFDYNDKGAIYRIVGNYVVDFVGHRYSVIDSTSTTITVLDIYHTGQAPQTGQIARCYRSVYNGESKYVGSVDYSPLDESARWKMNGSDNEILWRHGIDYELPFKRLVLDTNYIHNGSEIKGTMAWDSATQSVETHIANDLYLNNGEELWVPLCYNNTGSLIINGSPVYINSAYNGSPTISIATNITYNQSRLIGIATEDIPTESYGRVTRFGFVNGVNLSSFTNGDNVYLGNGTITNVRPTNGSFVVTIGKIIKNETDGRLLVCPQADEYTAEINKVDGWPSYLQGEQTNLYFTDATRTAMISPVGSSFYFYQGGIKYIKYTSESYQTTDVEGLHYIYYDNGVLTESVNPSVAQLNDIMKNKISVGIIYWDATNKTYIYGGNERHTFHWPFWVRAFVHTSFWTQYLSGLGLTNITLGVGSVNADAQFGMDAGSIADEDIITSGDVVASTSGLPIYYRSGANGVWRRTVRTGYSFLNDGTTGLAMYNKYSGGVWSVVSMTNNYYRLVHVFMNNGNTINKQIVISGIAEYSSAATAEAGISAEIANIYNSNLPFSEMKHIGTLILHTKTGIGNSVNARYVATIAGGRYVDFRKSTITGFGGSGTTTGSFLGLSDTQDSYAGQVNKIVGVNNSETGVEFKAATMTAAGTINIPNGQQYQINGGSVVVDAINDGVTTTAPSQNAVFDALALKENISNKENTTVDNSTTKYPTVNLLKTYADTKLPITNINGTIGYIPKFTGTNSIGNSPIYTNGSNVGIGYSTGTEITNNKLAVNGSGYFNSNLIINGLISTNPRLLSASSTGQLTPISDGTNGQVLSTDGLGEYSFTTLAAVSYSNNYNDLSNKPNIPIVRNKTPQTLTGTTPTFNIASGLNAILTLSGNTTITMSGLEAGDTGNLTIYTHSTTVYTLNVNGYNNSIARSIGTIGNYTKLNVSGSGSKRDQFSYYYDGIKLQWTGTLNSITQP